MAASPSPWNTLEVAKLAVGILTPVAVVLLGWWIARLTRRVEASQWVNQKLVEKRIKLLEEALPRLNDMYCYFKWVGNWKALSPADIIQRKRELDRIFFANQAFFSTSALTAYQEFTRILFKTYAAPGIDAKLRTAIESHDGNRARSYPARWKREWSAAFVEAGDQVERETVERQYQALTEVLGAEVDIGKKAK